MGSYSRRNDFALELINSKLLFNLRLVIRCTLLYFIFKLIKYSIRGNADGKIGQTSSIVT